MHEDEVPHDNHVMRYGFSMNRLNMDPPMTYNIINYRMPLISRIYLHSTLGSLVPLQSPQENFYVIIILLSLKEMQIVSDGEESNFGTHKPW